ncbi:TPA: hypothetical protein QHS21_005473, partial [Klebsiella michiganensis]|nr:hypothetical protein [Klebsiella michiganensis]
MIADKSSSKNWKYEGNEQFPLHAGEGEACGKELFLVQAKFLFQIVDIGATVLEIFVVHDARLQLHVGFDT